MITKKLNRLVLAYLLAIPLLLFSCTPNGDRQDTGSQGKGTQGVGTQDGGTSVVIKDCYMMKDGKMVMEKDGKISPMETSMTMENGTTCTTNGELTTKEGKKMMMKEGDCLEMSGKNFNEKVVVEPEKDNAK